MKNATYLTRPLDLLAEFFFHTNNVPNGHKIIIQRRINVDATSWRCIDLNATLYKHGVTSALMWRCTNNMALRRR